LAPEATFGAAAAPAQAGAAGRGDQRDVLVAIAVPVSSGNVILRRLTARPRVERGDRKRDATHPDRVRHSGAVIRKLLVINQDLAHLHPSLGASSPSRPLPLATPRRVLSAVNWLRILSEARHLVTGWLIPTRADRPTPHDEGSEVDAEPKGLGGASTPP
jgi:hypothetical protein